MTKIHKPKRIRLNGVKQVNRHAALSDAAATQQPEHNQEVNVGRALRALCVQRGLSIRVLAEKSGLAVNTLSLIQNNKTSPSVSTLQQLASALEYTHYYIFRKWFT